jgi:hypothetical protein
MAVCTGRGSSNVCSVPVVVGVFVKVLQVNRTPVNPGQSSVALSSCDWILILRSSLG